MCCFSLNTLINVMYRLVIDMNSYNIHSSRLSPFNLILMVTRMDPNGLRLGVPDRAGKDLARRIEACRQVASPGHFWIKGKRGEKPETRYGLVNDYIRISGKAKNNKRQ